MASSRGWGGIARRRSRRELVGVVVVLALLGGISLFALAGARRTQSAYPRFLRAAHASTMALDYGPYIPEFDAAIASRPEVERSTTYVAFPTGALKDGVPVFEQDFETLGTPDGRFFTMDRFTPTEGRLPDPDRVDEVVVNETSAESFGYHVGQVPVPLIVAVTIRALVVANLAAAAPGYTARRVRPAVLLRAE